MRTPWVPLLLGLGFIGLNGSCMRSSESSLAEAPKYGMCGGQKRRPIVPFAATLRDGQELSYYRDIKPIITANCETCHRVGGLAPFTLESYAKLKSYGKAVKFAVQSRAMPPWSADPGHQEYRDDISLSDEEIATISAWVDGGYVEGNALDYVPPPTKEEAIFDVVLPALPEGETYLPDQEWTDEYRCFVIPIPENLAATPWVTGFTTIPGNAKIIHHLVAHTVDPDVLWAIKQMDEDEEGLGYRCAGGALPDAISGADVQEKLEGMQPGIINRLMTGTHWMSHWAPGMDEGVNLPEGLGLKLPIGSAMILQMHYYVEGHPGERDLGTKIAMKLASSVEKPAFYYPLTNMEWLLGIFNNSMVVEAQSQASFHVEANFEEIAAFGANSLGLAKDRIKNLEAHSANIHMHAIGSSGRSTMSRIGQMEDETLLSISYWDLHWQRDYQFRRPKVVAKNELSLWTRKLTCNYDNPNAFPVFGGPASSNEMCYDFALFAFELDKAEARAR